MREERARVLLVEDHDDTRLLYRVFLEGSGFDVTEAVDGEEALSKALAGSPDVMVLDIGLPKLDGFEVARRLSQLRPANTPSIIAVSAHAAPDYEEEATRAGCSAALRKPCMPNELLDAVNRMLAGRS